jgi:hypothetical protein
VDLDELLNSVESRQDLARFVLALKQDLIDHPDDWENVSLEGFLDALSAWIGSMHGYFKNQGLSEPDNPDWKLVGMMLLAASMYE